METSVDKYMVRSHKPPSQTCGAFLENHLQQSGFTDVDAELEQLTMDAGRTPSGVSPAHPADHVADFAGKRGSAPL